MAFRDWKGKWVELLVDLTTRGGRVFPKGLHMLCDGTHRGRLSLTIGSPIKTGYGVLSCQPGIITRVSTAAVRPLDGPPPESTKKRFPPIRHAIEFNKDEGRFLMDLLEKSSDGRAKHIRDRVVKSMR